MNMVTTSLFSRDTAPTSHLTDVAAALLATEPKYRKYTQQVDKCLSTFENVQDWADCTAFLSKLLKVCFP
jgi:hypothetical protein